MEEKNRNCSLLSQPVYQSSLCIQCSTLTSYAQEPCLCYILNSY